jgi:hypothetical protein
MRTTKELKTLLMGSKPNVVDSAEQAKVWDTFSADEQEAIRKLYHISYEPAVDLRKPGDAANAAGSLTAWAEVLEDSAKTVRSLAALNLEIEDADVCFITLTGANDKLEEAVRAGLADRMIHLDDEKVATA